ncbi:MAG: hypothetical protein ACJ754_00490 [Pyrinomonadaceae bacterium]
MNAKQRRLYERVQRVVLFMEAHAEAFPAGSKGAVLLEQLKEALAALAALDVARASGASKHEQGSAGRRAARAALRALLKAVVDTGRTIAVEHPDVAGIFDAFADADRSDLSLVAVARSAADTAAPLVGLFVDLGLPPTFVLDLRSKADSLENYISLQTEGLAGRADSNASAAATLRLITGLVKRLDTVVRNKYHDDPTTLASWERARRVESDPQHKDEGNNAPPNNNGG